MATKEGSREGNQCCAQLWRFVLFAAAIAGIVLSIITAVSCDFLTFNYNEDYPPDLSVGMINTTFSTGLFLWDPSGEGCRGFSSGASLGLGQTGARIGAATAVGCAVAGMSIVWIEYICCRFCGGRFLEALCFVVAFLGQASTFLLYSNDLCTSDLSNPYPCKVSIGSFFSMGATVLYLACSILICCTPKPEPTCVGMKEETKNDPCVCFCCFRRKKKDADEEAGDEEAGDEEAPPPTEEPADVEPTVPEPAEEPPVTHANAVVVGIEESSYYGASDYQTETEDDVSKYWPSKSDEKEKAGQASLPTYRDVAFIEGDVFFDTDDVSSSIKK